MNVRKLLVLLLVLVILMSGATACGPAPEEDAASAAATVTAATAKVSIRTATAAPAQAPTPVTEKVEPQEQRFYLDADGILAMTPSRPNSHTNIECLSECTKTWAITLTHPLQGNAYGYDSVGISGNYDVRLLHTRGDQQTVLAEWLNRSGWQGGPQIDARPGDVLTLQITAALGASWQPLPVGGIDYVSDSYVAVGTTQEPLPTFPPPPTPTPVVLDTSAAMEIHYGDVITEEIKPSGNMDIYTFDAKAGDIAHIAAAGTEDAPWLSLKIQVFDAQGQPVGDESRGDGEYNLTADGLYTLTVRDSGTRTGPYNVMLKNMAPGAGVRIAYGDAVEEEIAIAGETDVYTFEGKAGDEVLIALSNRPLENSRAELVVELLDPHGKSVRGSAAWVGNTSLIAHTLTTDGAHDIRVWMTGQLNSPRTGAYTLLLKNVSTAKATPLSYGATVTETIKPAGDQDIYVFDWKVGDVPIIEATKASLGNSKSDFAVLDVDIYDSQGNSLAFGSIPFGSSSIQIKPAISNEGTYTIVVQEEGEMGGKIPAFGTLAYTLSLKNLATP